MSIGITHQSRPYGGPSQDPLMDAVALTQGGLPHLVELLLTEYRRLINERNSRLHDRGLEPEDPDETIRAAEPLLDFFREYLTENRPVEVFPVDENYGLLLSNHMRCAVSPGVTTIQGSMQDSGAVGISTGLSQPSQPGAVEYKGYQIR